jgi:hypothetical protein
MTRERTTRTRDATLVGLGTVACWAGWMGWDRVRDVDPVSGVASGPYQPWQVVGCLMCLVLVAVLAVRRLPVPAVAVEMAVVFTLAWSTSAATTPGRGANLWPIGAALILPAMLAGTAVVAGAARALGVGRRAAPGPGG